MSNSLMTVIRFLALVAIQVLVMNKVQFNGYLNPYIYILFILVLPLRTSPLLMIMAGFILGIVVDFYSGMMGIHTAATLFVSYFRNRIMKVVIGITEEDFVAVPGLKTLGSFRFIYYAAVITLIHHLILFYLEVFSFHNSADTLLRVLANAVVSLLFMIIAMILFERRKLEH
jgi:rod shape-determining protein MreD